MARKRIIDPEFWSDEEIGKWSFAARLFYIGLWNFADDEGRFKAHNNLLKAQIFPYEEKIDIDKLKKELNHKIQWYEVEGLQYGFIRNFLKHQRIERPTRSKLPTPPQITEGSPNNQGTFTPNIIEDNISKDNINKAPSADSLYIYDYYKKNIKAGASADAIKSIAKLLKTGFTKEDLIGRIDAYKALLIKKPTDYIIQANNFFGEKSRYKDFEPIKKVEYMPPNPDCKSCKGIGKVQNGEGQIKRCYCVKEKFNA